MKADSIQVEVVVANRLDQQLVKLTIAPGSTVIEALRICGLGLPLDTLNERVGIFGRRCDLSDVLSPGDRVEVYRPLLEDPKLIRRKRAARAKGASAR